MLKKEIMDKLMEEAEKASEHAYAPYSGYKVGAAVLCRDGTIYRGCNVENASFGLTICAERVALFNARTAGKNHFDALAIYAPCSPLPVPCGACRQVMAESGDTLIVLVRENNGPVRQYTLEALLPESFHLSRSR